VRPGRDATHVPEREEKPAAWVPAQMTGKAGGRARRESDRSLPRIGRLIPSIFLFFYGGGLLFLDKMLMGWGPHPN
jgi:hypothetical protein